MDNSPHLRPAFLLDAILARFAHEISQGKWQHSNIPKLVSIEDHLQAMRGILLGQLLPQAKLWEMYTVDIESTLTHFARLARERGPLKQGHGELTIQQDPQYRRNQSKVDMEQALSLFNIQRSLCTLSQSIETNLNLIFLGRTAMMKPIESNAAQTICANISRHSTDRSPTRCRATWLPQWTTAWLAFATSACRLTDLASRTSLPRTHSSPGLLHILYADEQVTDVF